MSVPEAEEGAKLAKRNAPSTAVQITDYSTRHRSSGPTAVKKGKDNKAANAGKAKQTANQRQKDVTTLNNNAIPGGSQDKEVGEVPT